MSASSSSSSSSSNGDYIERDNLPTVATALTFAAVAGFELSGKTHYTDEDSRAATFIPQLGDEGIVDLLIWMLFRKHCLTQFVGCLVCRAVAVRIAKQSAGDA